MNKPTISQVLESFMHGTLHRLTSGEPECRTGWNYPATRDWPCAGLNWAPKMKKALHDIEGSPAGTGSSHPFLLRRNSSGGWRRDVRPGGGTILFMSAEADVVRSDKSGSKPCRFCVFYVFRVQQCFVIVKLFLRRKRYLQLHNVIPRPKGRCRIGRDRPNCIHFNFSDIPIQL